MAQGAMASRCLPLLLLATPCHGAPHSACSVPSRASGAGPTEALRLLQVATRSRVVPAQPDACGESIRVNSSSLAGSRCPAECPFYAEEPGAVQHCSFACVTAAECASTNPAKPVPDRATGMCRECRTRGCRLCAPDGSENCLECEEGSFLSGGRCYSASRHVWSSIYVTLGVLLLLLACWLANLLSRPVVNRLGLERALRFRERCKLRRAAEVAAVEAAGDGRLPGTAAGDEATGEEDSGRAWTPPGLQLEQWPLSTNLCKEDVGGVGLVLFFNFQAAVIAWGLAVLLAWLLLAAFTSTELLTLGLSSVSSTRDYCIVVQWGHRSQQELSRVKEVFVLAVYIFSSLAVCYHSVRSHRILAEMDDRDTTMKDFAAVLAGLPPLPGSGRWEERLGELVREATGQEPVGVSICWDHSACQGPLLAEIQRLERRRELRCRSAAMPPPDKEERTSSSEGEEPQLPSAASRPRPGCCISSALHFAESRLLKGIADPGHKPPRDVPGLLADLRSASSAFVVFRSERARDLALEAAEKLGGIDLQGSRLAMVPTHNEPASVIFGNACFSWRQKLHRLLVGFGVIVLAQVLWTAAFYMPYAHYMLAFTSAQGVKPGVINATSFSLVVVIGNQLMYYVCREVATRVGFMLQGQVEVCYIVLYSAAILFNVLVDLCVVYSLAYYRMVAAGIRTHDGKLLDQVGSGKEIFESYVMQKDLGSQLLFYFFPATCLLPFLFEPLFLYVLPLQLMKSLIKRHAELTRFQAEELLRACPMDLGRYADLLANVFLAVLVFLFPGGFTVLTFGALVICHLYVYCYDHFRVMRVVPSFCISSEVVANWTTALLSVPCGILLSTVVFKTNCQPGFPCVPDRILYVRCATAFLAHLLLHLFLLLVLLPRFFRKHREASESSYEDCARLHASSWFTTNPVHCLRSLHIYGHEPPCDFYSPGKEHLLRANPVAGQFFQVDSAQ